MEAAVLWLCLAVAAVGAIEDARARRIPNWLCLVLAAAAATFSFLSGGGAALGSSAIHMAIALVIGMVLFRFGFVGGGDAKFYAACALAVPLGRALPMLGWTSLAGFFLLLMMVLGRKIDRNPSGSKLGRMGFMVPYGVAIAAGFTGALLL